MPQFKDHALEQFVERRPDLFAAMAKPHPDTVQRLAHDSFYTGTQISREEASRRIQGPVYPGTGDICFRSDGTGAGVWVVLADRRRSELVVTFLVPGMSFTLADLAEATQGLAESRPVRGRL